MAYCATQENDYRTWDYLWGDIRDPENKSISIWRREFLSTLARENDGMLIAFKDPWSGAWTKHRGYYGAHATSDGKLIEVETAYDIHRSVLKHEIVVESDELCNNCKEIKAAQKRKERLEEHVGCEGCYVPNYEAARVIGRVMESKGFIVHYYYSGSKSIHMHVFVGLEWKKVDKFIKNKLSAMFKYPSQFVKKFMEWLRRMAISCWGTNAREFDDNLVSDKHLIRAELSRNKYGFKTFLGYSYKDLSFVPEICNEKNKIYPRLGAIKLSLPEHPQELIEEFLAGLDKKNRIAKVHRKEASLMAWMSPEDAQDLQGCIYYMLSDQFKEVGDGARRAMFYLANALKQQFGPDEALALLRDWNERVNAGVPDQDILYRVQRAKEYTMTCRSVHEFLEALGVKDVRAICHSKAYKPKTTGLSSQ